MTSPCISPYGTWASTITAERVAAGTRPVSTPRIDGDRSLWLQGLPEEGGRLTVMTEGVDGHPVALMPPPFNVRTRVHEYGGGAWAVSGGTIWFSNFADNRVYRQHDDAAPVAITASSLQRFADFELDLRRDRLIAVREQHAEGGGEPVNTLVALGIDGAEPVTLVQGNDFYASPRLSPDGRSLCWLTWNHPAMPWEGTELWLADVAEDGALSNPQRIGGGPRESLCQPVWSPDGVLHGVSDRSGFWNLYRRQDGGWRSVCPMAAEFGLPQWVFAQSSYGFNGPGEIIATCRQNARSLLLRIDIASGNATSMACGYDDITELRVGPGFVLMEAGSPTRAPSIVRLSLADGVQTLLATSAADLPDASLLSVPRSISFPSEGQRTAHAFHYAPHNAGYAAPAGDKPPLIVIGHGGPTGMAVSTLKLAVQFWTSRGFAVLDVNYGGSTGFGRAYRQQLSGQWGIVDVEDCIAGARWLASQGLVDPDRMAIRGGSAGGYTTLSALTFHDVFKAGASYYGVADLRALDADTHKFESRYTTDLIAPMPERERLYAGRSPIHHAHRMSCPVIFFQGLDDKVVPPAQSESMVAAMRERGIRVAYLPFEGEGHGFRRKESLQRAQEAELSFYGQVFGFEPADRMEPVLLA